MRTTALRVVVVLCSIVVSAAMFAFLGTASNQPLLGAMLGSGIGGAIGVGIIYGRIGWLVVGVMLFSFLGAIVGPGFDAPALHSAIIGAAIGAFVGDRGLRGMSTAIVAILGSVLGVIATRDAIGFYGGFLAGGISGYHLGTTANRAIQRHAGSTAARQIK